MSDGYSPLSEKEVVWAYNRPDMRKRKEGILFHDEGPTGWGRIRRLNEYKGSLKEGDFHHEHSRFADPSEAAQLARGVLEDPTQQPIPWEVAKAKLQIADPASPEVEED